MADIELVIKIPEEMYQKIKETSRFISGRRSGRSFDYILFNAVNNGIPLPKGHADLISKEQAIDLVEFYQLNPQHFDFVNLIDEIKDEKPIIEADKESEGKHEL